MASATRAGSPRISVIPAALIATSVPVAIAMPMSAEASAGASLIPSPTMATTFPLRNSAIFRALSAGSSPANASSTPTRRATACAAPSLSPVSITVRTPSRRKPATAAAAPGFGSSPNATTPNRRAGGPMSASQDTVLPAAARSVAVAANGDRSMRASRSNCPVPNSSRRPCTVPSTPRPGSARKSLTVAMGSSSSAACARNAAASGCSLPDCRAAARRSTSAFDVPSARRMSVTRGLPSVSVPVLSNATRVTACACSSAAASRIRMPWRAAAPVPTMIAVGVASPSAHGQAITITATAASKPWATPAPASHQPSTVSTAMPSTTGTNTALTRSARRCTGAFDACAPSTSRTIRASVVSAPTAVTPITSIPSPFIAPPVTRPPTAFSTGRLSPVSMDSSTLPPPSLTLPSTGMRSPGRTTTVSPTRT